MSVPAGTITIRIRCRKIFFSNGSGILDIEVYGKVYPPRRVRFDEAGALEKGLMCNKGETLTSVKKNANNSLTTISLEGGMGAVFSEEATPALFRLTKN